MNQTISPLYAAIDLGSNSFHMLVARQVCGSIQIQAKIKRKVRLAAGLDKDNQLNEEAMLRGWDCLALFAERLQDIDPNNIKIVGTATLRTAKNIDHFLNEAQRILGYPIQVISGEEEAATIYKGVAHSSAHSGRHLVVDIGGASTELIIGQGFEPITLTSLKMGCVTWLNNYFSDHCLLQSNFDSAIAQAKQCLAPITERYLNTGWEVCVGASGTIQALQEIMLAQGMDETITLDKLYALQQQALSCKHIEDLSIEGLAPERVLVFPSGLAILIAIFEQFNIKAMTLAGGALREGLLHNMMPSHIKLSNPLERTIDCMQQRYQIDSQYADQVARCAATLVSQCGNNWLAEPIAHTLLQCSAQLHELGLTIDFKKAGFHNHYLVRNSSLPGLTVAQKELIAELLLRYKDTLTYLPAQQAISQSSAIRVLRLLRLAVILTHRRDPSKQANYQLSVVEGETLRLVIDKKWLKEHPLTEAELEIECEQQSNIGWMFHLN